MSVWFFNLPIAWMALVTFGAVYLFVAILYRIVTRLAVGDNLRTFKGISPGILPPLAILFALLQAFLGTQVWNDLDRANVAVNREASALRGLVLLATRFPGEPERRLRDWVRQHVLESVEQEWPQMAESKATLKILPVSLAETLHFVLALKPETDGQIIAQREMVDMIHEALEARRLRIILSASSVNPVKWAALLVQAALTLIAIALVHSDHAPTNRIILTIFSTAIAMSLLLLASHSRPFSGDISVQPTALLQIMPETET